MHNNALFDINRDVSNNLDICFYHFNDQIKLQVVETYLAQLKSSGGPALCSGQRDLLKLYPAGLPYCLVEAMVRSRCMMLLKAELATDA